MRASLFLYLLWISTLASAQPLPQLYHAALATDPAVAGAEAQIRAAEQRVVQARAAFGPTAALVYSNADTRYYEAPDYATRPFVARQLALQVTQPLFRPALYFALQGAESQYAQAQSALEQAHSDAMQRLVEACFEVLKGRDALAFTQAQGAATAEQLASARRSFTVGTSPVTDVREAEAKADLVAAELSAAQFDLDLREQILAELTGEPVAGLLNRGLRADSLPSVDAAAVRAWLVAALEQSPQVRQARHAYEVAQWEVSRARQGHVPTADLTASYGKTTETGSITSIFPRRARSAQVGVNISVPLFASGATHAHVLETIAARDKAQSDIDAARRTVTLGVRQNFSATLSAISQAHGLEAAVKSAELELRANRRGYEVGMKVNSEVLDSQTRLFEALRDLSKARYDAWINFVKLAAISGKSSEDDLIRLEGLLVEQPAQAMQETKRFRGEPH